MRRILIAAILTGALLATPGCAPDTTTRHRLGDAKPSGSWAPTAPSGAFFPNSPTMPYTVDSTTGAMLTDAYITGGSMTVVTVSGGSAATTSFSISGGTIDTIPLTLAVGSGTINAVATPAALPSNACHEATLVTSGTGVLCGTGAGACSVPLPQNMPLKVRVANTNQLYVGSASTVNVGYIWSN